MQAEADAARTQGVTWQAQLQAVPLDASANTRGIRRAADKVGTAPSEALSTPALPCSCPACHRPVPLAHQRLPALKFAEPLTCRVFSPLARIVCACNTSWNHALQVLLPPTVGSALLHQNAAVNGAPFFELRTASGACTHVGVLDYSAAEGTIALPLKVIRSLWGPYAEPDACAGLLQVKYVRLEKGGPAQKEMLHM